MLTFITTIRHPVNSRSYDRIGELLDRTLQSICRQTDPRFCVAVVHNDPAPPVRFQDRRVHFVQVNFPPPGLGTANELGYAQVIRDKGTKSAIGVSIAREMGSTHVMFVDADDLINHKIAEIANANPHSAGWFSPSGFIYTLGMRSIQPVAEGFNLKNGSTNIVRIDLTGVPTELTPSFEQREILESIGSHQVDQILGQHEEWCQAVAAQGETLVPLPFPSAIWVIGTGENHSGNIISARQRVSIDLTVTDMFGLTNPGLRQSIRTSQTILWQRVRRRLQPPALRQ